MKNMKYKIPCQINSFEPKSLDISSVASPLVLEGIHSKSIVESHQRYVHGKKKKASHERSKSKERPNHIQMVKKPEEKKSKAVI